MRTSPLRSIKRALTVDEPIGGTSLGCYATLPVPERDKVPCDFIRMPILVVVNNRG